MGKGGGGIGAMGAGGVGKGPVRAGVRARSLGPVSSQGQIDKEAVAKAINSHLAEVQRCYERALLKNPGLAGKVVLEWSISTQGTVVTLQDQELHAEGQLGRGVHPPLAQHLAVPARKGTSVIISYPFIFNAVGF